jgi:hypothetical protein
MDPARLLEAHWRAHRSFDHTVSIIEQHDKKKKRSSTPAGLPVVRSINSWTRRLATSLGPRRLSLKEKKKKKGIRGRIRTKTTP